MGTIADLIIQPQRYFAHRHETGPSPLLGFTMAMFAFGLMTWAKELALRNLPTAARSILPLPTWLVALLAGFFGALLLWGALTVGLTLITGDSARVAELVGLSLAPLALGGLVQLALAAWLPVQTALPPIPDSPQERLLWSANAMLAVQSAAYFRAAALPELLGVLWGGHIFYTGARVFFPPKAAVTVAVYLTLMLGLWLLRNPFILEALK